MKINLLRAIRLSRLRIEPAVKQQAANNRNKERFMRYLRVLSPLGEIPLVIIGKYDWYLDGRIHPQSKTGIAFRELIDAGLSKGSIWYKRSYSRPMNLLLIVFRITWRLPRVGLLMVSRFSSLKKLDLAAIQVIIGYLGYKAFFSAHNQLRPVINSDISPFLHMQWAGALAAGNKVMWWQDDHHHYDGFSDENYCPYRFDIGAILNSYGLRTAEQKSANALLFARPSIAINQNRTIPEKPRLGFASNVLFEANEKDCKRIEHLMQSLRAEAVLVRLHPNSKLHGTQPENPWMHFADPKQSIVEFAKNIDLVVVGNSAVQLKLLCAGVPVIHTTGFDRFGFDLYRYCQLGLVYGKQNAHEIGLETIQDFYNNFAHRNNLKKYVQIKGDKLEPLNHLKDYV